MDLVQLNSDIQYDSLSKLYIFTGEEIGLQNIYINQILKLRPGKRVDTYAEIKSKIVSRNTLFPTNAEKYVYIIRDDFDLFKNEKEWDNLSNICEGVTLILLVTHIDKKTKFYKHFKELIVEFNKMTEEQLYLNISNIIKGNKQDILYFIQSCNNDYSTIMNNIDKYNRMNFTRMTRQVSDEIAPRIEAGDVFKLTDYLISLDYKRCFEELDKLLSSGANELGILSMIGNKLHQTILVEGYKGSNNIAKDTGLNKWVCANISNLNCITPSCLLTGLRVVNDCEQGVKLGYIDPQDAVISCIVTIFSL